MKRHNLLLPAVLTAVVLPLGSVAGEIDAGEALFGRYCATCHGPAGQGDGPTGMIISVAPTDLTALAAAEGGVFPFSRVIRRIDGRDELLAHGSPMPIYGAFFDGSTVVRVQTPQGVLDANAPVVAIVRFLETLQRP